MRQEAVAMIVLGSSSHSQRIHSIHDANSRDIWLTLCDRGPLSLLRTLWTISNSYRPVSWYRLQCVIERRHRHIPIYKQRRPVAVVSILDDGKFWQSALDDHRSMRTGNGVGSLGSHHKI